MKTHAGLTLLAAVALALLSSTAEAQWNFVPVPSAAGTNFIGSSGNFPIVLNDTTCTYFPLNSGHQAGALIQNTEVDGVVNQANRVSVVAAQTTVCGATLQPINLGAFKLDVMGGSANDVFLNIGLIKVRFFGQAGNDLLINITSTGGMTGDDGNDLLIGSGPTTTVAGFNGDDIVCSTSAGPIQVASGGNHTPGVGDSLCGSATAQTGFEHFGCTCPLVL